jgi:stage III sporulation protein AB
VNKVILSVVFIFLGTLAGIYKSSKLRKREETLSGFIMLLGEIETMIQYRALPVEQIISETAERYTFSETVKGYIKQGLNHRQAWTEATETLTELPVYDKTLLVSFGANLGGSDISGQTALIKSTVHMLTRQLELATEEYNKKGKVYRTVGMLIGLLIAIITL